MWEAPPLSASAQECPVHRCRRRVEQLSMNPRASHLAPNPSQDTLGVWLCASHLTSLCSLSFSENQITVSNKYITCKVPQCLDVISAMLMLSAVIVIVTTVGGNVEIRSAEGAKRGQRTALKWLLPLWESVMAGGLPYTIPSGLPNSPVM